MGVRLWTQQDDEYLKLEWGVTDIRSIASLLDRSPGAVRHRAVTDLMLKLERDTQSMRQVAKELGYSVTCVRASLEHLGMVVRAVRANTRGTQCRTFGITPEMKQRLLAYLQSVPDGGLRFRKRQITEVWGPPCHPPACIRCQRTSVPHYAKGRCRNCYRYKYAPMRKRRG